MHAQSTLDANDSASDTQTEATATTISSIAREFQSFVADMEDLIKATTSLSGEALAHAKAKLQARVTAAKKSAQRIAAPLARRARNSARATDGYVHAEPWRAIAITAAAGLLVGYLLGRRG
jgi:ElaB/YqjD/DUF883 family membrane-anchored ribosome-binding protein